jgi:nucleotide-binding universal stress UspA family protein
MPEIRTVLVPIDLHQHSEALADFALQTAQKLGAEQVTFLHVIQHVPDFIDYKIDTLSQLEATFRTHAESRMTDFLASIRERSDRVDGIVIRGDTVEAILAFAEEQRVDLIIIATHGTKGIEKVLLGSVADRVIKNASCPTLVFNPFAKERGYEVCHPLSSCVDSV